MDAPSGMTPVQFLAMAHAVVAALSLAMFITWAVGDWWIGRRP